MKMTLNTIKSSRFLKQNKDHEAAEMFQSSYYDYPCWSILSYLFLLLITGHIQSIDLEMADWRPKLKILVCKVIYWKSGD